MKLMLHLAACSFLTLLSAEAFSQSVSWSEFMGGSRETYSSLAQPKAKGLEVSFGYPKSWTGIEGKRPNILYQVTSEHGKGLEMCNLAIRELPLPVEYTPSEVEIKELFEQASLSQFIPAGSELLEGAPTKLDGQPGAWVHYRQEMQGAGLSMKMHHLLFPTYYDKKLIIFSCALGAGPGSSWEDLQERYDAFMPLFQQMANSLIIHSRWKAAP